MTGDVHVVASVLRGRYVDSIMAMRLAQDLERIDGVLAAAALMGTPANHVLLETGGFACDDVAASGPDDLVVAVKADSAAAGRAALDQITELLDRRAPPSFPSARTFDDALGLQPTSNLVSISVPGEHAAAEATRALEAGLHVFCFSSGVALDDEIRLKELGAEKGLLCMGPDCGTSIIGGVGLGFANAVRRGPVGVVGGSGTGIQAMTCLLDRVGLGTSHAFGAGSRDLSTDVGGRTTFAALQLLEDDPSTEVIVVVSKPGGGEVVERLRKVAAASRKHVVLCILGDHTSDAHTIDEAVTLVAAHLGRDAAPPAWSSHPAVGELRDRLGARRWIRGLFSGGSLCAEAQLVLQGAGLDVSSNAALPGTTSIADEAPSRGHCLMDLGTEVFTTGRPHPMIDSRIRRSRLEVEGQDPDVAVILLDVVLGWNAARSPAGDLAAAIRDAVGPAGRPRAVVVASVVGTDADTQVRSREEAILEEAGALVAPTNALAASFAAALVGGDR